MGRFEGEGAWYHLAAIDEDGIAEEEEEVALGGILHGVDGAGEDGVAIGGQEAFPDGVGGGGGAKGRGDGGGAAGFPRGREGNGLGDASLRKPLETRVYHPR